MLALSAAFAVSMAGAAGDPWIGTWHRHGKNGAPDTTLTITPVAGGYTFVRKDSDAPVAMPFDSTCHRMDARSIACKLSLSGADSDATYSLSAAGKTLTDSATDPEPPGHPVAFTDHVVLQKE
ncbi:MAG TPA: hypothetical protein VJ862_07920 [Rhodanobacteraceae bacterium]|nr:hypothetical protein [Rhodanobacteraceae bacterium]